MHAELNPFAPGSGLRPPALVGRQSEIDAFDLIVARTRKNLHSRGIVLHGLRGVGKTVLLNQFRSQASRAGWFLIELEGRPTDSGMTATRQRIARSLVAASRRLSRMKAAGGKVADALGTIKSFSLSLGVASIDIGVEPSIGRGDSGDIEIDLEELVEDLAPALIANSSAFAIFIDEMQDVDGDLLTALLAVQHRAGQEGWPFFVIGAGLPSLPSLLSGARSYSERLFDYRRVGSLDDSEAAEALTAPAKALGMAFDPLAVLEIVAASEGYPYFIQTFGFHVWDLAAEKHISLDEARAGIDMARAELDVGFYPARWDRATPSERRYLQAMAEDDDAASRTSDLARRLGTSSSGLSTIRQAVIEKGIVFSPERGLVSFTVPGMAAFIQRSGREEDGVGFDLTNE